MKNILYSIMVVSIIILANSCKKNEPINQPDPSTSFENGNYDPAFDWNTAKIVDLVIASESDQVINITSVDGKIRYYRGMHFAANHQYKVKLSIPKLITQIKINNTLVSIDSELININLK